jgi:hypothetical protein
VLKVEDVKAEVMRKEAKNRLSRCGRRLEGKVDLEFRHLLGC